MSLGLRIFVSSTFEDLEEYRKAIFGAIHSLGEYSEDMIYWSADERNSTNLSIERVKECDALILILAHRYGYVPKGSKYSITELEYRAAREKKIPIFAFFIDETFPWPPNLVEWEKRESLQRFKKKVESDVTRKIFNSPDNLATQATQALVSFMKRKGESIRKRKRFKNKTIIVDSLLNIKQKPNLVIQIGLAEDGLPLLFTINRSKEYNNIKNLIIELDEKKDSSSKLLNKDIFTQFQNSLENLSSSILSEENIHSVNFKDGTIHDLYITTEDTLSTTFQSTLSLIMNELNSYKKTSESLEYEAESIKIEKKISNEDTVMDLFSKLDFEPEKLGTLDSVGGTNRFLGISITDGKVFSVGMKHEKWVEWRPFLFESISSNFPDCHFKIISRSKILENEIHLYKQNLLDYALENSNDEGQINVKTYFVLNRQSIGKIILNIAHRLKEFHNNGKIHGDLKPANILLTKEGPYFIDDFNLNEGHIAPGWTRNWSAPEQFLGEPVSYKTDIYPLGIMLVRLLSGHLVGEVRKYKTPPMQSDRNEFDLFYNPSIYIYDSDVVNGNSTLKDWTIFARSCLRFEQSERPSIDIFIQQLETLLQSTNLLGEIAISISNKIVATTLLNGEDTVARLIEPIMSQEDENDTNI